MSKVCRKESNKAYYQANKEKAQEKRLANKEAKAEYDKAYNLANKEKLAEYHKAYYQANKADYQATKAEYNRAYRLNNKEKGVVYANEYYQNNRDRFNTYAAKRRAAKLERTVAWADSDVIKALYTEAQRLTEETGEQHHVDHIIPLQGALVSGLHVENNLQVLTACDNLSKSNTFNIEENV